MAFDAKDPRLVHVEPNRIDLPDIYHEGNGPRVTAPSKTCALCKIGICVQRLDENCDLVVVHARSRDA